MNEEIKKYQKRVIEILRRDYFPENESWSIFAQPVVKNNDTVVWDSGKVESHIRHGIYCDKQLEAGMTYEWSVTCWFEDGQERKWKCFIKKESFTEVKRLRWSRDSIKRLFPTPFCAVRHSALKRR